MHTHTHIYIYIYAFTYTCNIWNLLLKCKNSYISVNIAHIYMAFYISMYIYKMTQYFFFLISDYFFVAIGALISAQKGTHNWYTQKGTAMLPGGSGCQKC